MSPDSPSPSVVVSSAPSSMVASAGWNMSRLGWRSFPGGPSRGGAGSVDDPTGRPATPTDGP
eukprot:7021590-Lingulodinium_polyedra.AAC.1